MRITVEKAESKIRYIAMGIVMMVCLLLFGGNTMISHAAEVIMLADANVRSGASTDSAVVTTVDAGDILSVSGETTGADGEIWFEVSVNNVTGYVRSDLTEDSGNGSSTETSATVSETGAQSATANTNANVRKGPSSSDSTVGKVNAGDSVAITGETIGSDGNVWYQVEAGGNTGYIRSDLLDVDSFEGDAGEGESAEEGGSGEESEGEGEESPEGEEGAPESPEEGREVRVISTGKIPADMKLEDMTLDRAFLEENVSDDFYLLYIEEYENEEGETEGGWYLYSLSKNEFEKLDIDGKSSGLLSSLPEGKGRILMIAAIVLFVVLMLVCIMLAVKLREYREYGYDDEEYEDDDDEDYDDEEDDDDEDYDDDEDDEDDEDDDEDDDDEDEDEEDERPRKRRWSPRNFLSRRDEDDEDDDDEEDYEDDDDDDEDYEDDDDEDDDDDEYLDDDDFEFEFLNMDEKDDF